MEYISKVLFKPMIDRYANVIEVHHESEEKFIQELDGVLAKTVFSAGCSNWYINSAGRNSAAWPGLASTFWKATFFPKWKDFELTGGSFLWPLRRLWRNIKTSKKSIWIVLLAIAAQGAHKSKLPVLQHAMTQLTSLLRQLRQ